MKTGFKMAKLDFYTLKEQLSSYLVIPFIVLILSPMKFSPVTLAIVTAWLPDLFHINVFAIQEKNGLERLYGTLAISQKEVVAGRYLFANIHFFLIYLLALVTRVITSAFHVQALSVSDIVASFCIALCLFTIISAPQFPIFYKMGYLKGKMYACIPYFTVMVFVMLPVFYKPMSGVSESVMAHTDILCVVCLAVSAGFVMISYHASVLCYKKQR